MPVGVQTITSARPSAARPGTEAGARVFFAGLADRGPTDRAVRIGSLNEFVRIYGDKVAYSDLYNAVRFYYEEGGPSDMYVSRAVGPAATLATITSAASIRWDASSAGNWAAGWTVTIATGTLASTVSVTVKDAAGVVQESADNLATTAAIAAAPWTYITPVVLGASLPAVATVTLAGGADDRAAADWQTCVDRFVGTLGAGLVCVPGMPYSTTVGAGTLATVLKAHCNASANRRIAYLDLAPTATPTDAQNAASALRAADADSLAIVYPRPIAPDGASTVSVPGSAVLAAKRAYAHRVWGPGRAPAGDISICTQMTGVATTLTTDQISAFTDSHQIIPFIVEGGLVKAMGNRSLSTGSAWRNHATRDLINVIASGCTTVGQPFVMRPIDGKGQTIAAFNAALNAYLSQFAQDATPNVYALRGTDGRFIDPGYVVDTGPGINTPATIALGQLRAVVSIRPLPLAELVRIEIVNVGV